MTKTPTLRVSADVLNPVGGLKVATVGALVISFDFTCANKNANATCTAAETPVTTLALARALDNAMSHVLG